MYRFDLINYKEYKIKDSKIFEEKYNLYPVFCKSFGDKFVIYSDDEKIDRKDYDDFKKAHNDAKDCENSYIVDVN